jgi:PKD repeat protein
MHIIRIFVNGKNYSFMKQIYILILIVVALSKLTGQTTLVSGVTANGTLGANGGYQFQVENTNAHTIRLFRINTQNNTTVRPFNHTFNVWFKPGATNAAPGAISVANGWTNAGSFAHNQKFNFDYPVMSNMAIDIPAGATYRIWISCTDFFGLNVVNPNPGGGLVVSSGSGVNLRVGDSISYWGVALNNVAPMNQLGTLTQFTGSIEFDTVLTCAGKPQVGNIIGTAGSCANDAKFYYLEGYKARTGITYQWQVSTTSSTAGFTNTGTPTTMLARTHGPTNEFIRCIATCGTLRDTTPVFADTLNPFYLCYCPSNATNTADTKIDSVRFLSTVTGSPSSTCETYTDYRSLPILNMRAGETYNISVVNGSCSGSWFNSSGAVFVDFNRNGVWDAAERIGTGWTATALFQRFDNLVTIPMNPVSLGITGVRVLHREGLGTPPTSANMCGVYPWGETEDYLIRIIKDSNDIRLDSITGLADGCDLGNVNVNFRATNVGIKAMNPVVVSYSVNGGTPVTENFASLAPGANASYTFTAQANMAGNGAKVIKVWHHNSLDTNKANDTQTFTIHSYPTPPNIIPIDDTVCVGSTHTTLTAVSNPPFITRWYTDAGTLIDAVPATGNDFVINSPTSSNVRYAKSVFSVNGKVGPTALSSTILDPASTGQGLLFNVLRNKVRINSVKVRFNQAGVGAIEIRNAANTSLQITSFLVLTANTDVTVPLNISLPIGTGYRMVINTPSGQPYAITNFTSFPQTIPGVISITGNTNTFTPPRYNYFFDWDVTYDACSSPVVAVNSVFLPGVTAPLKTLPKHPLKTSDTTFCEFSIKEVLSANLNSNDTTSTYKWSTGSTLREIKVATSGVYTVTITNVNRCKSVDSARVLIMPSPEFSLGNDTTICSGKTLKLKSGFTNAGISHSWGLRYAVGPLAATANTTTVYSNNNKGIRFNVLKEGLVFRNFTTRLKIAGSAPARMGFAIMDDNDFAIISKFVEVPAAFSEADFTIDVEKIIPAGTGYKLILTSLTANATIASVSGFSGFPILEPGIIELKSDEGNGTSNYNYFFDWQVSHRLNPSVQMEPYYEVNSPGWYYGYVFNTNTGCGYESGKKVSMVQSPNAFLGSDTFGCNNNPIIIQAPNGNYNYNWDNGVQGNGPLFNKRTVTTKGVNKVWVNVTDISNAFGCVSSDTVLVTLASLSKPNLGSDVVTCTNPYSLGIIDSPNLEYRWSNGGTSNNIKVTESDNYVLTVTQVNTTCSYMDTVKVTIRSNPPIDIGPDIVTCKNDPITITANTGWTTYAWSNSFNVNKITVVPTAGTSTYTLTVTGPCGNQTVSKSITYTPGVPDVDLPADKTVCAPETLTIPNPGSGVNILWSTDEIGTSITVDKTGTYWVSVSNECGSKSDAIRIIFDTLPTPDFSVNWNFIASSTRTFASFSNKSSNAISYFWEFGDDSTSTDKHPTHLYNEKKQYTVKLTVKNSCDSSKTFTKIIDLTKKPSGIQSLLVESVIVYPNPSSNVFTIQHSKPLSQNYTFELMTMDGRIVKYAEEKFDANGEMNMSVSDIATGSYFLRVTSADGAQELKKLSIIR